MIIGHYFIHTKNNTQIKSYFEQVENSTKKNIIASYALFKKDKGLKINDETCEAIITEDEELENFYTMKKIDRVDYLSKDINWETTYIENQIKKEWFYDYDKDVDSIQFISTKSDTIRARFYSTHYCKYQKEKSWHAIVVMLEKKDEMIPVFKSIKESEEFEDEDEDKTAEEIFEELRLKVISRNRDNDFLNGNEEDYDDLESLMNEFDF